MKSKTLNYRIIIESETNGKNKVFVAYCPSLGISDFGKTIQSAKSNITKAIQILLETQKELKLSIPQPNPLSDFTVTNAMVYLAYGTPSSSQTKRS